MANQMSLIPVSPHEFKTSAYRLAQLLQQKEDEEELWKEARTAHKETMAVYNKAINEERSTIRRAQQESEEGLMGQQIDALLNHDKERQE